MCVLSLALPANAAMDMAYEPADEQSEDAPYTITTAKEGDVQCINIEGRVYGKLTFPPRGDKGFGYDPIFVPTGYAQTFGELSSAEKQTISHRANAFKGFMKVIRG